MNILFYGYGNHAKSIKKYLDEIIKSKKRYCFLNKNNKNFDNITFFNEISEVENKFKNFSCVFITSPNELHLSHLKDCINLKIPYIYVEKPALGIEDYLAKRNGNNGIKFLQIGYQYNYEPAIIKLKNIINEKSFGSLLRLDIFFGKGIAFKDDFKNKWRSKNINAVSETFGSHLINIIIFLLGKENIKVCKSLTKQSNENSFFDTFHFSGFTKDSIMFSLTASWGSPLNQTIKAYFSDMVWTYDMEKIVKKYPRDCFNEQGLFMNPPTIIEECGKQGIKASVSSFLKKMMSNQEYEFEFNNSSFVYDLLYKEDIL